MAVNSEQLFIRGQIYRDSMAVLRMKRSPLTLPAELHHMPSRCSISSHYRAPNVKSQHNPKYYHAFVMEVIGGFTELARFGLLKRYNHPGNRVFYLMRFIESVQKALSVAG